MMMKNKRLCVFILHILLIYPYIVSAAPAARFTDQDTSKPDQVLYNGRLWRNLYSRVLGDQFLFSPDNIQGTVCIAGRTFRNVPVQYDIYKDELITRDRHNILLQLNKEHIDSFMLDYNSRLCKFINLGDSTEPGGFVQVLYDGRNKFYIKYRKKIELLAVEKKFDTFYQVRKMYLVKNNKYESFNGRLELFRLFGDNKKEVKAYLRKNKIRIMKDLPESFVPAIEYYDRLSAKN